MTLHKDFEARKPRIDYPRDLIQGLLGWLGDHQVNLKPGMMVVIPQGTAHAGFTETDGHLKWVSLKTPPQDPADVHPM